MQPNKEKTGVIPYLVLSLLIITGVLSIFSKNKEPENQEPSNFQMQALAEQSIKDKLKDPNSAEFRNFKLSSKGHPCGEVNSKNGFGGYTGFKRYMIASKDLVAIEGESLEDNTFNEMWLKFCEN